MSSPRRNSDASDAENPREDESVNCSPIDSNGNSTPSSLGDFAGYQPPPFYLDNALLETVDRLEMLSMSKCSGNDIDEQLPECSNDSLENTAASTPRELDLQEFQNLTLAEVSYPKPDDKLFHVVQDLQKFDDPTWFDVCFQNVLNEYTAFPGFADLFANKEIELFDDGPFVYSLFEKTCAAITHAALIERDLLQKSLQALMLWAYQYHMEITPSQLGVKLDELFGVQTALSKASYDILQIARGKRAELIQLRRSHILKNVNDQSDAQFLAQVPPSATHLFNEETFSHNLNLIGGVDKVFTDMPNQLSDSEESDFTEPKNDPQLFTESFIVDSPRTTLFHNQRAYPWHDFKLFLTKSEKGGRHGLSLRGRYRHSPSHHH